MISSNFLQIATMFSNSFIGINDYQNDWKERIKQQWRDSKSLPRKQKKAKRKELNLDWSIANYNPFNF
jgi:hypothetical protein